MSLPGPKVAACGIIGIDANDEMLALATKYQASIGERIGYHNVEFRKGRIQDLRLDLSLVGSYLAESPVASASGLARLNSYCAGIRTALESFKAGILILLFPGHV